VQSGGVSSLIFLVVIGVWAAYFIQYWVRRRDHLATARSVDQFSESMRVLERRTPLPAADPSTPTRDSHAAGPAHRARAQLLVKRGDTLPVSATVRAGAATTTTGPTAAGGPTAAAGPAGGRARGTARPDAGARVRARRNRAMVMLGALSTLLVAMPLVVLGLLGVAYLAVPAVSVGIALAWVRRNARSHAARPARAGARSRSRAHDTPTSRTGDRRVARSRSGQAAPAGPVEAGLGDTARAESNPAETKPAASNSIESDPAETNAAETDLTEPAAAPTRVRGELYDLGAIEAVSNLAAAHAAATLTPVQPLVDEDDIPLTWDPVPVPRPTYTLKARATRPAPAAADLVGDADTEYAAREDELPVRQVAGA
jgi:hypothetical protein